MKLIIRNIYTRSCALLCVLLLSGCAALLAPADEAPVDIQKLRVGMPRAEVEQMLGAPTSDIRPEFSTRAFRRCEYQYFLRDKLDSTDPSLWQKISNKAVGFQNYPVIIDYDRHNRVMRITFPAPKGAKRV